MEPEDPKYPVFVHIYDISQGMAKNMSQMFLGKQIDGIWHTGVVVYGKEYYFGGGICAGPPKQTPFGFPTKIEKIGETQIPQDIFHDFLSELSPKFSINNYDLFKNNCNNFAEECCQFLTGSSIPSYVTGLPAEVLNTPLGKIIEPMISNIQNQMLNNPNNQLLLEGSMNPQALNFNNPLPKQSNPAPQQPTGVIEIKNYPDFSLILQKNKAVVVDFFSLTCPPCMRIKPIYAQIAQETEGQYPDIRFCACNVSQVKDVATQLNIASIPTFVFYHNGNLLHRFSGANEADLRKQINNLKTLVGPRAVGEPFNQEIKEKNYEIIKKSPFSLCNPNNYEFFLYKTEKKDFPINKIKNLGVEKIRSTEHFDTFLELASNIDAAFQYFIPEKKKFLLFFVCKNIEKYLENHSDEVIPFYDLLRIMIGESSYCSVFFQNCIETFMKILQYLKKDQEKEFLLIGRPIKILILRMLANGFSSEEGKAELVRNSEEILDLLRKLQRFYAKTDKMCVESCVMIQLNYLLSKGLKKERQREILEEMIEVAKIEDGSDNVNLGVVLSVNFLIFEDKGLGEIVKKNEFEKVLAKAKVSKNERVVFAAKDCEVILEGKI